MIERMFSDDYTEALFSQVVRDNCQRNFEEDLNNREPIEHSQSHIIKMQKLIRDDEKRELRSKIFTWSRRLVAAAAAFVIIASGVLLTVPEVRAAVVGAIENWTEKYTEFSGEPINNEFKQWTLGYVPEGFVLTDETMDGDFYIATYMNDVNLLFNYQYTPIDNSISVNNENLEYTQINYEGTVYHIFKSIDINYSSSVIWDNGTQLFCVSGDISSDDLLKIAKNIV
jgi:hypothetical protein